MSQESFDQRPTTPVDCMLLTMSKTAAAAEVGGLWPLSLREITELHAFCCGAAGRMLRSYSTQERIPPPLSQLTDFASSIKSSSLSELSANSLILLILAKQKKPIKSVVYELTPTGS
jgi:hypothetical protein